MLKPIETHRKRGPLGSAHGLMLVVALITLLVAGIGQAQSDFHYEDYALALDSYVDGQGMVNYQALKVGRESLDAFTRRLAALDEKTYNGWSSDAKVAFWINTYNGLTLKAIIDNYPIKASRLRSLRFPKNSIRQISGVWTKLKHPVMGQERTLDDIEHKILRAQFNEPRIHMALVCAAMGCPALRNEPYTAEAFDEQLDDQTRRFVAHTEKFRIDRKDSRVYLSSIFKWFGEDFIPTYGTKKFSGHSRDKNAVLNFVSQFLSEEDQTYLHRGDYSIKYLDYDWSLNEQANRS